MKTEEQIKEQYENFLKDNPREWVLNSKDVRLQAWYDGYKQAIEEVLNG